MAFQSNVRQFMTSGVVGEVVLDGAIRSRGVILKSTNEANNIVGRALTYSNANADGVRVEAGGGWRVCRDFDAFQTIRRPWHTSRRSVSTDLNNSK